MSLKIRGIVYDWYYSSRLDEAVFSERTIGRTYDGKICLDIEEYRPCGEGDKWRYIVYYSDKTVETIFNINRAIAIEVPSVPSDDLPF